MFIPAVAILEIHVDRILAVERERDSPITRHAARELAGALAAAFSMPAALNIAVMAGPRFEDLAAVFVQIGLAPNTEFPTGTIGLSRCGKILSDDRGATSLSGVFAADDATTGPFEQIVIAAVDGAKAGRARSTT